MTRDPMTRDREPSAPMPWWWNASLIALGLAMALFRLIPTEADPDLWGHLRFGLDTIARGEIVRADIYSYLTAGQPWINHEWLAEAIMATFWNDYGDGGLVAVKVLIGLGIAFVICRHLIERGVSLLGALLMTAYGMAVILPGLRSLRPQAFTYLAFALLLVWMHRSRGQLAWMMLATPLMWFWANLHGGFVAGLGVIVMWAVADTFRLRGRGLSWGMASGLPAILALASIGATATTPYGWRLWTFLAHTLGPRPEIVEWQGVSLVTVQGLAYLAVAAAGIAGLFLTRRERLPIDIMLIVCAVLLPLIAQRHLPLTVLIVLVIGGEHIASAATTKTDIQPQKRGDRFRPLVAAALIVEACVLLVLIARSPTTGQITYESAEYPVEATARLAELAAAGGTANVAIDFNWGEYVIWHAGPRVKVSMDGRRETVYSDAVYHDNTLFFDGVDDWDRLLQRRPGATQGETDLALVPAGSAVYHLMSMHPDWELVMESGPAALFGRRAAPVTSHLHAIPVRALGGDTTLIFP